jgi:heptaprenyl diphosphate synthase
MSPTRRLTRLGLLGSAALILFVLEGLAPRPLPWMRLGLGNAAVLLALLVQGTGAGLAVAAIKALGGGLLSGGFGGPAFVIGGGAGMASVLIMGLVQRWAGGLFSPVGISILGALTHQCVQLGLAYLFYVRQSGLWALLPIFLLIGLVSGTLIGLVVSWVWDRLKALGWGG